ncbi:amidohydrolase [Streptomyces yokosukanensis]|uniref:Amidohydrolase n=1 Tax=Streptomyces yokosukanensis TaxID=67386 RepID=A0A101NM70_9ACTN|nr:amidohydrolase family protein [Streptomyces yokosukanensis]KUM95462.1 amidohydrolase [Streptomyces yokosukanensis]
MKLIALEEAFAVPELLSRQPLPKKTLTADRWMREWNRLLVDFTEERLPDMDAYGIDIQVLSLTVPGIQGIADTTQAIADARQANDFLATVIARHPDRFAGFAALPLQDPEAAADELERAVTELGLRGALVNDHTGGHYYDEPQFDVVWSALEDLDVPLYLHPGAPPADSWHVLDGRPELIGPLWTWGAETGAHALRLVLGGVFDRHPRARLILGHMGEALPFQLARLDSRYQRQRDRTLHRNPSAYFGDNIHITVSGVWSHAALTGAIEAIGVDSIMFAIDYPYELTSQAVDFLASAPLADDELPKISHRNAERLLRLPS